ncbi:MAG TPA: 2Fe-2S iron-sulfur cluster-binding protein [Polyangia bacterium]|nr:2Fe-2S iron-sulfur cluster-binding protein [Polyangia bacterium]
MPRVTFLPSQTQVEGAPGESLFDLGRRAGLPIETACVGQATCGLCRVKVVLGEQFLSRFAPVESKHLGNVYFINKLRLSCQARLTGGGDVTVEIPPKR